MVIFTIRIFLLSIVLTGVCAETLTADDWQRAMPGAKYDFPLDHQAHPSFKTEWWYFTGTLKTTNGKEYGYELTFFRQGVLAPSSQAGRSALEASERSRFVQSDFKFAHFAISDLSGRHFHFTEKISRGAFGEAGFGHPFDQPTDHASTALGCLAWIDDWSLQPQLDGTWKITAKSAHPTLMSIDLQVTPMKAPVVEGVEGISQKAAGVGNASYYYSYTRLNTNGTLTLGRDQAQSVQGESWFDHEWASNQLASDQVGWNWFCFQFEDQTELMLYTMRRRDGTVDPVSSGTWVGADGRVEHLKFVDFTLRPERTWHSPQTGATYPLAWRVTVPSHQLDFAVESKLDEQELVLPPISYWEGAVNAQGQRGGQTIKGHGYMELTGYASALVGLQGKQDAPDADLRGAAH